MKEPFDQATASETGYNTWLSYPKLSPENEMDSYLKWCGALVVTEDNVTIQASVEELKRGLHSMLGIIIPTIVSPEGPCMAIGTFHGGKMPD
jgi:alpha-glucuronidase